MKQRQQALGRLVLALAAIVVAITRAAALDCGSAVELVAIVATAFAAGVVTVGGVQGLRRT